MGIKIKFDGNAFRKDLDKVIKSGVNKIAAKRIQESGSKTAKVKLTGSPTSGTFKGQITNVTEEEAKKITGK